VRVDAHAARVHQRRPLTAAHVVEGGLHPVVAIDEVGAIDVDDLEVREAPIVVADPCVRALLGDRNGDAVAVVLHHEDHRQPLSAGPVEGLVDVALAGAGLALARKRHAIGAVVLGRARDTDGVQRVVPGARGHVLNADRGLPEVVRHVAPTAGHIGALRQPVEQDLVGRQPRRQAGEQVAVVGEEEVSLCAKGLTEGELDAVMPREGGMKAPAHRLANVEVRLGLDEPPEVGEAIPLEHRLRVDPRVPGLGHDAPS